MRREEKEVVLEAPISHEDWIWAFEKVKNWPGSTTTIRGARELGPFDREIATVTIRRVDVGDR